jgi:hypothetical protein
MVATTAAGAVVAAKDEEEEEEGVRAVSVARPRAGAGMGIGPKAAETTGRSGGFK